MVHRPLNVLLVDDDESAAVLFRLAIERAGGGVHLEVVGNGKDAIAYLARQSNYSDRTRYPVPDVIVLDLIMPGVSGFDVLDWRQRSPEAQRIPVVVFTGSLLEADKEKALAKGADRFITKPVGFENFAAAIVEILHIVPRRGAV